jgi:hypothetical protein
VADRDDTGSRRRVSEHDLALLDEPTPPEDASEALQTRYATGRVAVWAALQTQARDLAEVRREVAVYKKIAVAVALAAVGSLGTAVAAVRSSGERDGREEATIGAMERSLDAEAQRIDRIEGIFFRSFGVPVGPLPTAGGKP